MCTFRNEGENLGEVLKRERSKMKLRKIRTRLKTVGRSVSFFRVTKEAISLDKGENGTPHGNKLNKQNYLK